MMCERLLYLSLSLAMCGSSAAKGQESDRPGGERPAPGFHRLQLTLADGQPRRYSLLVPEPRADGGAAPLVMALHYGGEVTPYYGMPFLQLLVAPAFEELDAYIVAPDCPDPRGWTQAAAEETVLALLDHALRSWPVDRRRVVITGFSLGGIGTWYLAARHPQRFSAAVPVAGYPVTEPDGSVPIYALHSRRDEVIDSEPSSRAIAALKARGATAELVLIDGPSHYQTTRFVEPLKQAVPWLKRIWDR